MSFKHKSSAESSIESQRKLLEYIATKKIIINDANYFILNYVL